MRRNGRTHSRHRTRKEQVLAAHAGYRLVLGDLSIVAVVGPRNARVQLSLACARTIRRQVNTLGARILKVAARSGLASAQTIFERRYGSSATAKRNRSAGARWRILQIRARLGLRQPRLRPSTPSRRRRRTLQRLGASKPRLRRARAPRTHQRRSRTPASCAARQRAAGDGDGDGPGSDPPRPTSTSAAPASGRIVQHTETAARSRMGLRGGDR